MHREEGADDASRLAAAAMRGSGRTARGQCARHLLSAACSFGGRGGNGGGGCGGGEGGRWQAPQALRQLASTYSVPQLSGTFAWHHAAGFESAHGGGGGRGGEPSERPSGSGAGLGMASSRRTSGGDGGGGGGDGGDGDGRGGLVQASNVCTRGEDDELAGAEASAPRSSCATSITAEPAAISDVSSRDTICTQTDATGWCGCKGSSSSSSPGTRVKAAWRCEARSLRTIDQSRDIENLNLGMVSLVRGVEPKRELSSSKPADVH